jgi:hypothetical protein
MDSDEILQTIKKINMFINDPNYKNTPIAKYVTDILNTNNINLNKIELFLTSPFHLQILILLLTYINNQPKTEIKTVNIFNKAIPHIISDPECYLCKDKIKKNTIKTLTCHHATYHIYCYSLITQCPICHTHVI